MSTFMSGFCSQYGPQLAERHARCALVAVGAGAGSKDLTCECPCHVRWVVVWTDWTGATQIQAGWSTEEDATLFLDTLREHEYVDPAGDTEVESYIGESPW